MTQQRITKTLIGSIIIWLFAVSVVHAEAAAVSTQVVLEAAAAQSAAPSDDEISSFGCIIGGVGLVSAAYLAGPTEAIMLWGGGLLTPSGTGVLALSIIGGLGGAGCSFGATAAPALAWGKTRLGL